MVSNESKDVWRSLFHLLDDHLPWAERLRPSVALIAARHFMSSAHPVRDGQVGDLVSICRLV